MTQSKYWGTAEDALSNTINIPNVAGGIAGNIVQVSNINSAWYALTSLGQVYAWGNGTEGQLGNGLAATSLSPVLVGPFGSFPISFLAEVGPADTMFCVDTSGQVWGWGSNQHSQLGNNSTTQVNSPIQISLPGACIALAGAGDHSIAAIAGGTVYTWGCVGSSPYYGQLGLGIGTPSLGTPTLVPGLSNIRKVFAAWRTSAVLDSSGNFIQFGYNGNGNCGNGDNTFANVYTPTTVSLPSPVSFACVGGSVATDGLSLVWLNNSQMWAWGNDTSGQLGDGGSATAVVTPIQITPPATFVSLKCTGTASFGLDTTGKLWGWGNNATNQMGNGTVVSPVLVPTAILNSGVLSMAGCGGACVQALTEPNVKNYARGVTIP